MWNIELPVFKDNNMSANIEYDYSAAEMVLQFYENRNNNLANEIAAHPAYKLVYEHSKRFSSTPLDKDKLIESLEGKSNNFIFTNTKKRSEILMEIISYLKNNEPAMQDEFAPLAANYLPVGYSPDVTVWFTIGGFNGIALNNQVAMNIDYKRSRSNPQEILLYLPHELFHIGFAHYQQIPDIFSVRTQRDLLKLVMSFTMNEGLATLVPYEKRISLGAMDDYDYSILSNNRLLIEKVEQFKTIILSLSQFPEIPVIGVLVNDILSQCSGDRLFYIVGCHMGMQIEQNLGRKKLIELIKQPPEKFFETFESIENR